MVVIAPRTIKWTLIALITLILAIIYYSLDPADYSFFPKCPFNWLTGYKCPGCGSQRAIHHLLTLNFVEAFRANPLLVISLPYIILGFLFDYTNLSDRFPSLRKTLFGTRAIIIIAIIVLAYWLLRNISF